MAKLKALLQSQARAHRLRTVIDARFPGLSPNGRRKLAEAAVHEVAHAVIAAMLNGELPTALVARATGGGRANCAGLLTVDEVMVSMAGAAAEGAGVCSELTSFSRADSDVLQALDRTPPELSESDRTRIVCLALRPLLELFFNREFQSLWADACVEFITLAPRGSAKLYGKELGVWNDFVLNSICDSAYLVERSQHLRAWSDCIARHYGIPSRWERYDRIERRLARIAAAEAF